MITSYISLNLRKYFHMFLIEKLIKKFKNYIFQNQIFIKIYWTYFHVDNLNTFNFENDKLHIGFNFLKSINLLKNNDKIIDYGCSNGSFLFKLNEYHLNYNLNLIGIDYNIKALRNASAYSIKMQYQNITFLNKPNNLNCNLLIIISTIIYMNNTDLNRLTLAENILIITTVAIISIYRSNKKIFSNEK